MSDTHEVLASIHKPWKEFLKAWKQARSTASEKSIHDLRVSTRRMIASLEVVRAASSSQSVALLQKQFKKDLKRMGPLRDLQVQLEKLTRLRVNGVVTDFKRRLERREEDETKEIRDKLKPQERRQLERSLQEVRSIFDKADGNIDIRRRMEEIVRVRRSEFFKTRRRFKPGNDETLHEMRIALKKFRYVTEVAAPYLGKWAKESADTMHAYQQLMGDSRDVELLRNELEKWAAKRGKMIAVVPVLDRLSRRRMRLLKSITKSSDMLEHILPIERLRPTQKTTRHGIATPKTPTNLPPAIVNLGRSSESPSTGQSE